MASTREIKKRIKSVSDTQKITNAMYLISSTKMRRARQEAESTRPYFMLLRSEIRRIFAIDDQIKTKFFDSAVDEAVKGGRAAILVITADKGLAGSYNQNVIKETVTLADRLDECILYVVGEYGRRYLTSHGYNVKESFRYFMDQPTLSRARMITKDLLDGLDGGEYDRVYICYTEYTGGMSAGTVLHDRLIPFDKDDFIPKGDENAVNASTVFEYEPDVETIIDTIMPSYLTGYIYSALVNSYSAEQNARMMAMDSANENAIELLAELKLEYNHLRQNAITQEITEISSGARSLRKKKNI